MKLSYSVLAIVVGLAGCSSDSKSTNSTNSVNSDLGDASPSDSEADKTPSKQGFSCQQTCSENEDCKKLDKSECNNGVCAQCSRDVTCDGLKYGAGCDKQRGLCINCKTDDDCGPSETCFVQMGLCKQCDADADCGDETNVIGSGACDPVWKMCIGCIDDVSCKAVSLDYGVGTLCRDHRCVFCKSDDDCGKDGSGRCEPEWGECNGCSSDADCAALGDTYKCLPIPPLMSK